MEQVVEYMSLYEYLGRRAGGELGKEVFAESKRQKIRCTTKEIKQGGYEGKVMCYPRIFLTQYFGKPEANDYQTY